MAEDVIENLEMLPVMVSRKMPEAGIQLDIMKKRVFSGIQPSGNLHIGNYIGAIRQWVKHQEDRDNIFCIVDLHAITVPQDPKELRENIREFGALFFACGIDHTKSIVFAQSDNLDHANLGWILNCYAGMGQLERMTQFKDKAQKQEHVSVGLFDYPVLMAADILLYDTAEVPVGEDQKQHVELTRDLAERFNSKFGQPVFVIPAPVIPEHGARIMSLQDPLSKMSKSDKNPNSRIELLESLDLVVDKIKRAVTDSGSEIRMSDDKPAVSNLLQIFSEFSGKEIVELEREYAGVGYGKFKQDLAEVVVEGLKDIQERYREIREGGKVEQYLQVGAEMAMAISSKKLELVRRVVGLGGK